MYSAEISKHWRAFSSNVALLQASGRRNRTILAVLATESFFRPAGVRCIEMAAWVCLTLVGTRRAETISVGLAQAQVRHWRSAALIDSTTNPLFAIAKFCDPRANYDACLAVLRPILSTVPTAKIIALLYTGKTTDFHVRVLSDFLELATRLSAEKFTLTKQRT